MSTPAQIATLKERIQELIGQRPHPSVVALFTTWLAILDKKGDSITQDEIDMMENVLADM
jgi:hypothetical protein